MKIIVAIPVYKTQPDEDEVLSLKQCFKVLGKQYEICLVCPTTLNTSSYDEVVGENIKTERFEPHFFDGIAGYNELMSSMLFYERFEEYDYMLIYQLDAWVFSDELECWCKKGYDYIGAPWFEQHKTHEEGYGLWCCGNGGLSLRRVQKFIKVTNPETRLMSFREIFKYFFRFKTFGKGFKMLFHENNNLKYFRNEKSELWEDTYFCYGLDETRHKLFRPTPEEAAKFSFECSPAYLYGIIGDKLPFGCHAWKKFQYEDFWINYIPIH